MNEQKVNRQIRQTNKQTDIQKLRHTERSLKVYTVITKTLINSNIIGPHECFTVCLV